MFTDIYLSKNRYVVWPSKRKAICLTVKKYKMTAGNESHALKRRNQRDLDDIFPAFSALPPFRLGISLSSPHRMTLEDRGQFIPGPV